MICPKCHSPETQVIDKRPSYDGQENRRRRLCLRCQHRWTTFEVYGFKLKRRIARTSL